MLFQHKAKGFCFVFKLWPLKCCYLWEIQAKLFANWILAFTFGRCLENSPSCCLIVNRFCILFYAAPLIL